MARALTVVVLLTLAGCGHAEGGIRTVSASGNDGLRIEDKLIPALEMEAAGGSEEAAGKLARHYYFYERNSDRGLYWYWIAAENGGPQAMRNYAVVLSARTDRFSQERAKFWFRKVIESGVEPHATNAKESLGRMQ